MPTIPKKTGVVVCHHCALPIGNEYVRLIHGQRGQTVPDAEIWFCNADCMEEHFWEDKFQDKLDEQVRKEKNWLYKQVCPACRRRIT